MKKKLKIFAVLAAVLAAAALGVFLYLYLTLAGRCVKGEITVEAGSSCPTVGEFLNWENDKAYFTSDITDETLLTALGDYEVSIYLYWHEMTAVVHVVDTAAPVVETRDVSIMHGEGVTAQDFIAGVEDATNIGVSFAAEPDLDYEGTQTVTVEAVDEGGNITLAEALLEIVFDHEAPVISGVKELVVTEGDSVSYKKGVTVTDNIDEDIQLIVDADGVDLDNAGVYDVTYYAVDREGNEASETTKIYVIAKASVGEASSIGAELTEEYIYELADDKLSAITTDDMSLYEKAEAIYWWCHNNIAYYDEDSPKDNWLVGAYYGLAKQRGDCYTYAMTAKALLTRAGIDNFVIEMIPRGSSMHWWNAIDIGEGWHHFDTTRFAGKDWVFFYLTDEELMEFSGVDWGRHNYDRSLYPEIP